MKHNKRKFLAVSLIVCVVAILSLGSLAWFTAEDEVTNELNFSQTFDIDVWETDDTGSTVITDEDGNTVGRTYDDLMPGQLVHKNPTVQNTGTHPEWVRAHVTLTGYSEWAKVVESGTDLETIFYAFNGEKWTRYDKPAVDTEADTVTYTFYLNDVLAPEARETLFSGFTIPGAIDPDNLGSFNIVVKAEAIQSEYLPDGVLTAQQAFALVDAE